MKKYTFLLLLLLTFFSTFSQPNRDKIESLKVGFLSEKMQLDPRTAEKFWPLYHQYENELRSMIQEQRRANQNESRSVEEILDQEQKALDIKKRYAGLFTRVITNEQLNQLYRAEKDFRQILIHRAQKRDMRNDRPADKPIKMDRPMESRPGRMEPRPRPDQIKRQNNPAPEANAPKPEVNSPKPSVNNNRKTPLGQR